MTDHFIKQQFPAVLFEQVHHLDSDPSPGASVGGGAHHPGAALTDLSETRQRLTRITLTHHQAKSSSELEFIYILNTSENISFIYL